MPGLTDFLEALPADFSPKSYDANSLGSLITPFLEELPDYQSSAVVILGVPDFSESGDKQNPHKGANSIRKALYHLFSDFSDLKISDLGNIPRGNTVTDSLVALATVAGEIISGGKTLLILGGSHEQTFGQFRGYEKAGKVINACVIDDRFDLREEEGEKEISRSSFLLDLLTYEPNFLFNFYQLGFQMFFTNPDLLESLERLDFESHRLGVLRGKVEDSEPVLRDCDMVSFDLRAIKKADAPGVYQNSPNGFYSEEACRMARYSGMSDKLSSFGIYGLDPEKDMHGQTVQLAAEMAWYFLEGVAGRKGENIHQSKSGLVKYQVTLKEDAYDMIFWKSKKSGRWWMEVPYDPSREHLKRHHMVPCLYRDYEAAMRDEVPEKWFRAFEKLN